ncbi:peptidylprolyl isomerase [Devosia sp.]|uniref:peptidylprolyl isomerase n=1 Tax=Devosia sp. TaxID=1871048 RepID=UPI001AC885C7|nr:peptidylprolyl isomerase [Devosia sp.]MBN9335949.1 peptidylprolyl isomerase [Devosia sp.]
MTIPVIIETELGSFTIAVDDKNTPITAANFLAYVDGGHLNDATAYRLVTNGNEPQKPIKIEVVQWGYRATDERPAPFAPIAHETNDVSGIKHKNMTVSMARFEPGTAASEFFICIGDQPELDFGGKRNPDGQGFAAFGQVTEGEDTVRRIFAQAATESDHPEVPVKFSRVARA